MYLQEDDLKKNTRNLFKDCLIMEKIGSKWRI